jgi:hypothetical protein
MFDSIAPLRSFLERIRPISFSANVIGKGKSTEVIGKKKINGVLASEGVK